MTIKELRDILIHFQGKEYDDWEVVLWDYKNQKKWDWSVSHSFSKPNKKLTFPIYEPLNKKA